MIDLSKIRVGDEVTVRGKVSIIHHDDTQKPVRLCGGSWVDVADIISHTPAPREFKPGELVYAHKDEAKYEIIGTRGNTAFLWYEEQKFGRTAPTDMLRHADESE